MITQLHLGCTQDEVMEVLWDYCDGSWISVQYVADAHLRFDATRGEYCWEIHAPIKGIPEILSDLPITGAALFSQQTITVRGFNYRFGPETYRDGTLRVRCWVNRVVEGKKVQCIEIKSDRLELANAEMRGLQASLLRRELCQTFRRSLGQYLVGKLPSRLTTLHERLSTPRAVLFQEPVHN